MLTPKERLKNIINGKTVDRPACICPGGMMNMVTSALIRKCGVNPQEIHTNPEKMAQLAMAVYEENCFENVGVPFCMTVEAESLGAKVDLGSDLVEPHVVEYPLKRVEDYRNLKMAFCDKGRQAVVIEAINKLKREMGKKEQPAPVIGNLTGPISTATSVIEPSTFYKALRKQPEEAEAFLEYVTEELIQFGRAQMKAGADVIAISDPSGTGEILGPKYFSKFAVPAINRLVRVMKKEGAVTIVHICGQMQPVFEQVKDIESDVLSFDAIVSLQEVRQHLGNRLLMGNVSTYAIEFSKPDKITELTKTAMKHGADIVSPACGLGMNSPLENVQAILKAVKEEKDAIC